MHNTLPLLPSVKASCLPFFILYFSWTALCMNHSAWLEYRWNASECVCARVFIDALSMSDFHSSFQQSTMGNWELLHHLCCFGMLCSRKLARLASLSLSVFISLHFYYTHSLLSFIQWWQSMPKSNRITSLVHFQHEALFLFPPPALVSSGDESHRRTDVSHWGAA